MKSPANKTKTAIPPSLKKFIQALPKTETHLHVEGALPYELLRKWKPKEYPANPAFHAPRHRIREFERFDKILLGHALPWFTNADRYYEGAKAIFAKHTAQNVHYVETSFHLAATTFLKIPPREIAAAILAAAPRGLEVRVFVGMLRNDYHGDMRAVIDGIAGCDNITGVDLHGLETLPTEPWTARVWKRMRAAGKITKAHAGEFDGAARVREAIVKLGVTRIQHGARAIEDPDVVKLAVDRGVTFDMCPISNVRLGVVPSIRRHPIRAYMRAGIRCTVSTDDPLVFNNTLTDEYAALAAGAKFTPAELARLARNGFEVASLCDAHKQHFLDQIDALAALAAKAPKAK
ncbi:MAG: adenosine deaminase [Opitutaceae bacterium]|jgi:adenosine deaminase|nr:adenosine deaminase [Opitutaceae bacterium]